MNLGGHDIGVCSWSLVPKSTDDLLSSLQELQIEHLQLSLIPLIGLDEAKRNAEIEKIQGAGLTLTAGMIGFAAENYTTIGSIRKTGGLVPSETWDLRRQTTLAAGEIAQQLGIDAITLHLGFIPPGSDAAYPVLLDRAREIAKAYADRGIQLLFETGQERDNDLLMFLNDLNARNVGVNFDPANMILYGAGDPIEAIDTLGRHIRHVHIKDAVVSPNPGVEWGQEVPFGEGDVRHVPFLRALFDAGYDGPLVIECEQGQDRLGNIRTGIAKLEELLA